MVIPTKEKCQVVDVDYKCRRCGTTVTYLQAPTLNHKNFRDKLCDVHVCNDGQWGVADMIGWYNVHWK